MLYLVNAAEAPQDAGYLDAELQVLALIGKPVIVLLNQLGAAAAAGDEARRAARWRERTEAAPAACATVLALDAFARCWVQEGALLDAVARGAAGRSSARRSSGCRRPGANAARDLARSRWRCWPTAWRARRSTREARAAGGLDRPPAAKSARRSACAATAADTPREQAMQRAGRAARRRHPRSTDRLIRLHGLDGRATDVVLTRLAEHYAVRSR